MEPLKINNLAPYLPFGLKVQYEGILNGKEISDYQKQWDRENPHPIDADYKTYKLPEEVKGLKVGLIKQIGLYKNYTKFYIGNKNRGLKVFYGCRGFQPICFSLDNLTKPITINGETFVPIDKLRKMYPNTPNFEYIVGLTHVSNFYFKEGLTNTNIEYCVVQKLFEWKFAINLPEGSWIDVNTLEKNPYK